jgi:hypothetical protein
MKAVIRSSHASLALLLLTMATAAQAQTGLSRAVQALQAQITPDRLFTNIESQRLFGAVVTARIRNLDNNPDQFGDPDCVTFTIAPRTPIRGISPLPFSGPRNVPPSATCPGSQGSFEDWTRNNAPALLAILFPGSLGSSALGRGPGELHAQQFLLTTALATDEVRRQGQGGRALAGGLVEFETLRRDDRQDGDSAWAWQGLYGVNRAVSIQGRYTHQQEDISTSATSVSADYHPFVEIEHAITWRVGGSARSGFMYSRSEAMDLGSLEFGGGGWVSGFKTLGRTRVGGGALLQGSKTYVPGALGGDEDDLGFLADAINDRGIQYDLSFGGTLGFDTTDRTRVIVKHLRNTSLSSRDARPDSWLLLGGLSYRVGLPTVNVGYKLYSNSVLTGHSLFFQGNFDW